jgi:RND family efflux transporter MFP subunit
VRHALGRLRTVRRRWWVIALALVVLAGTGLWWTQRDSQAAGAGTTTATVSRGDYSTTVTASGTIDPARQEDLSFAVTGQVTVVRVAEGDRVRRGEVLARVDDASLRAQRDAAQASLDAALVQLDEDSDADASATQLAADAASVAAARSQLTQAKEAVDGAVLRSPIRGTVSAVNLAVGDQAGSQADAAAVTVISTRSFEVDASVGAADAASLKKGMQAEITPTGSDATVYGTVASIGAIATADSSGAATFPVTIDVTGRPTGLYAGSSADVVITTKKVPDVLTVQTPALHTEDGETWVWLVDATADGGRRKVRITTGTTYGMNTEVKSGLKEGDQVEIEFFSPTGGGTGQGNQQGPVIDFQGPPPGVAPQGSFEVGQ